MAKRIERIRLRSCRGATRLTEIPFESDKPLVLIFGANGTGKSTIVDAIDMVCNQRCGSIDFRSSANVKNHVPSVGSNPSDVSVELTADGKAWTARISGSRVSVTGSQPAPAASILRRSQLQRLVESPPAQRYKELARFIDVGGIEASEQGLKDAVRDASNSLGSAVRTKAEASATVESMWQAEGSPGSPDVTALDWAADKSAADTDALKSCIEQLDGLIRLVEQAVCSRDAAIEAHAARKRADAESARASQQAANLTGISGEDTLGLVGLLEEANRYITTSDRVRDCPVCEQPANAGELGKRLADRIAAMSEYSTLNEQVKRSTAAAETAKSVAATLRARFLDDAVMLAHLTFAPAMEQYIPGSLDASDFNLLMPKHSADEKAALVQARGLTKQLDDLVEGFRSSGDAAQRDLNQFNAIRLQYDRLRDADARIEEATELHRRLERAHEIVHSERIQYTQAILDAVAAECSRLYGRIHPGENLGLDRLRLDENLKGSLHQDGNFEGMKSIAPQAFFSESHLDTLGFCFWLAIAKHASQGNTVIVLDDVFTSADSMHVRRVIDLLLDECDSFQQIVVASHSRAWRDAFRYNEEAAVRTHLIELSYWKRARGIRHLGTKLAIDDLSEKLEQSPIDRQAVASAAGSLLEEVLDHLTLTYRCPVRRRPDGDYDLGELLNGVADLSNLLKITRQKYGIDRCPLQPLEEETVELKSTIDSLAGMEFIRGRVGSHIDLDGANISDATVQDFGQRTIDLARLLVCRSCGEVARRSLITHRGCACSGLKMEPHELI